MLKNRLFACALLCALLFASQSVAAPAAPDKYFTDVTLAVDTSLFRLSKNTTAMQGKQMLSFAYNERNAVAELRFYPKDGAGVMMMALAPSSGYEVLDSVAFLPDEKCFRTRIRFADLFSNAQLSLLLQLSVRSDDGQVQMRLWELPLFPYTQTWARIFVSNDVLFVGEEKAFEIESNNVDNIRITGDWATSKGIDYRVAHRDNKLMLVLQPRESGQKQLDVPLETFSPFLDANGKKSTTIMLASPQLTVKASRLAFLNLDKREVTYDEESRSKGVSIAIDNHRLLQIGKTYRIEDQETPGGSLIGELFTIKGLASDKVLCKLTVFNLHRSSEGYLYIKNGDQPLFIINLDITPKLNITGIFVLHEGEDWQRSVRVHPGETVDVAIVGESLHKAKFAWQDVQDLTADTIGQTETRRQFRLAIPMNINKHEIVLLNNGQPSGKVLIVEEYQQPHPLDYITLRYGNNSRVRVNAVNNALISRAKIKDFSLIFDKSAIDSKTKLYGKQYVDVSLRVIGRKGELIEIRELKNQLICPDETSPRAAFYNDRNCLNEPINLNEVLSSKPINLDPFGKVQIDIKNSDGKYADRGYQKRVEVVFQPKMIFDIDLSLPGGMMIQNLGRSQSEIDAMEKYEADLADYIADPTGKTRPKKPSKPSFTDNLGGISLALIAQLRFTDDVKPGKEKFYRVGAGFLFINAFNFRNDAKRDLAIVAVGSIYPLSSRRLWNVPIHVGFGYKIQDRIPFLMISPGISVSF